MVQAYEPSSFALCWDSEVSCSHQSYDEQDQAKADTFPEIASCSVSSPSLFRFPYPLPSVSWERFLDNVLHLDLHLNPHLRVCFWTMFAPKGGSVGWGREFERA